jgi:L-lactate dehydrogenase complex protein LldG
MEESTSREKILKNIRNALISKQENPFQNIRFGSSVYKKIEDALDITFATEFTKVAGKFVYCDSRKDFLQKLKMLMNENFWGTVFCKDQKIQAMLAKAEISFQFEEKDFEHLKVGITPCEYLVARLGSIVISSKSDTGRRLNFFPEIHIVMAYTSQLVPDIKDAIAGLEETHGDEYPSMMTVITGPSRTADIEKTLVMGAHGPKDVYVFLIDDQLNS